MKKFRLAWLTWLGLFLACGAFAQQVPPQRNAYTLVQGQTALIPNTAGSQSVSFEYLYNVTPASASITIQGCMRGKDGTPGQVGTCDTAADTYVGTANSIRSPSFTKVYDTFLITAGTLSAGTTLTVNTTVVVSKAGTSSSSGSGSGTVSPNNGVTNAIATYAAAGGSTTVGPALNTACIPGATSGSVCLSAPAVAGTSTNPITISNILAVPNGAATATAYGFTSNSGAGMYWNGTSLLFAVGGNPGFYDNAVTGFNVNALNFNFSAGKGQHVNSQAAQADSWGVVTCAASVATVTFTTAYTSTPAILLFDETTKGGVNLTAKSNTAFSISCTGATDVVDYFTGGNPN